MPNFAREERPVSWSSGLPEKSGQAFLELYRRDTGQPG